METLDAIKTRTSVRAYREDRPQREILEALIEAASHAPTTANRQAWTFTVVSDRILLDRFSSEAKKYMTLEYPLDLPAYLYDKLQDPDFHIFYHAPVLIVLSGDGRLPWMAEDCALAAQNLMLAAHEAGLGTCWIGLVQPYLATEAGRTALGLRPKMHPFAPLAIGYPSIQTSPTSRRKVIIDWISDAASSY
ncbi:MAG: nitroreductase [Methylocystis sp.]